MYITERYSKESRRDYALRTIKNNIVYLELKPGSLVSENELATEMGLSRGPVREALIELAKVKIVQVYPQHGIMIAPVDYDLIEEARFMRETLEIGVVERCCKIGLNQEYLAVLRENLKLQQFYFEHENRTKMLELDNEFHRLLFQYAGVMQVYDLMNSMLVHFDRVRAMALTAVKESKVIDDHTAILDAIAGGDAESAKNFMHKHLTRYEVDKEAIRNHYPEYIK